MKRYSKKWMQTFVEGQFPEDDKIIVEELSKKSFEVESVDEVLGEDGKITDSLFEIKVLPNRVSDAMSLRGMAREFSAIFDLKWNDKNIPTINLNDYELRNSFLTNDSEDALYIFTGIKVNNFDNTKDSPEWLQEIIIKSGGRSINLAVDITNLMLFSFGQPAHVFDFDKLNGGIITRFAEDGEELELLGGGRVKMTTEDFVIADGKQVLSLAGVKGGKAAEVDKNTKNCFFEMANFNPTMIRKTTQRVGVRTDASKIFENGITTDKTEDCLKILIATIKEIDKNAQIEFIVNEKFQDKSPKWVDVNLQEIENYAGVVLGTEKVAKLLKKQNFQVEITESGASFKVKATSERLDINIVEDVIEEVLRLYGFDNLPSKPLNLEETSDHNKRFLLENFLKIKLMNLGYTEIFNYTFVEKGEVKLKAGLAEDKMYIRNNLWSGAENAFAKNYNYLPILEIDIVKFFEIGSVFFEGREEKHLVIVCDDNKKKAKYLQEIKDLVKNILEELGVDFKDMSLIKESEKPSILEISVDEILKEVESKNIEIPFLSVEKNLESIKYTPISPYPFIVRDVAIWVDNGFIFGNLKQQILKLNLQNFVKVYLFDSFEKEGRKSVAFRIIFQSYEKTLKDVEVEEEMQKVYQLLKQNNFEIR